MKNKKISEYIFNDCGIKISKMLLSYILKPQKLETLNNNALRQLVIEYAPIYKRYSHILDGPSELNLIVSFNLHLTFRLINKPELQDILKGNDKN